MLDGTEAVMSLLAAQAMDMAHRQDDSLSEPDTPLTVYTIRFTTGVSRGSALSEPYSAVNVCLISQNGRAALHRISPVNDPLESRAHTLEMCQLIGPDVGADCSSALADAAASSGNQQPGGQQEQQRPGRPAAPAGSAGGSASSHGYGNVNLRSSGGTNLVGRPPPPPPPKRRFQEGSVDEVSILLPELGPLAGVLVGVEGGTWYLDEMDVSSSRTHHMDRFVCRRQLGGRAGEGAALLTPVPVGAVVYGEGEAAVVLSKEQATALWSLNMSDYTDLKRRVATTTALLVASGASLAALTGGTAAALPYTAGGVVGAYLSSSSRRALGSGPVRLGFVCASAALGMALLSREEAGVLGAPVSSGSVAVWQLALGALGFLTYKAALVGVSLGEAGASAGARLGLGGKVLYSSGGARGASRTELEKYKRD
ncbi:hypothetical protein VOLCADRAFT_106495 [Volvox carteri f. nagariensis]|uniref:Uncharacterized protein n=1 Tax=Volvox carteri f. nagariensis TaxID=3068 RepID=D8U7R6_VOLCA|nr:uncharacterized protein VOLCADRAFT_106495 [Volvox carteri f. nagariensis]EFJ44280.1 hypothetical protein VOLCADRAFT_106495 [Volvox carteri f. nagariensis]|eukprot:XP_002954639.1 hypothetical protein VOLCADRAFT_106495 [Volvox carteri f. nagariensis]